MITDDTNGKGGCVAPIRWNPLEGSSNGPAQVLTRGNLDYQNMARTFKYDFLPSNCRDNLRGPLLTDAEHEEEERLEDETFEKELPANVLAAQEELHKKGVPAKSDVILEAELRRKHERRKVAFGRGIHIGDLFYK